jgi:hypothetical protein
VTLTFDDAITAVLLFAILGWLLSASSDRHKSVAPLVGALIGLTLVALAYAFGVSR